MIPVVILGIVGGYFLASRALRPIRSLIQTVNFVSTGQMNARVPASQTGDELDELIKLFNAMLEKIEVLINGMRGSLDNVAHDLRTPSQGYAVRRKWRSDRIRIRRATAKLSPIA
jgi:nitrogen fixation/metabolism regulation signal transduction histidine kinase